MCHRLLNIPSLIVISFFVLPQLASSESQVSWYYGEFGEELIDEQKIGDNFDDFEGDYHFGESEMESSISITWDGDSYSLKHGGADWDGEKFVMTYTTIDRLQLNDSMLESGEWSGQFIYYYDQEIKREFGSTNVISASPVWKLKGLIIYNSPVGIKNELGLDTLDYGAQPVLVGDYTIASYQPLTYDDIKNLSKNELRLMRNEIFARYGYKFHSGGEMDHYFRQKDWYTPKFNDVTDFISDIEKDNILLIQAYE